MHACVWGCVCVCLCVCLVHHAHVLPVGEFTVYTFFGLRPVWEMYVLCGFCCCSEMSRCLKLMELIILALHFQPPLLRQTTYELRWLSGGKRGDYQNCSVLYCVLKLCTVISIWAVLTVLWIRFSHTGPISLCVDLFVFICVYFVCFCSYCIVVVLLWAWWSGPDGIDAWSLEPIFLQCFDTVGKVIWLVKTRLQYDL